MAWLRKLSDLPGFAEKIGGLVFDLIWSKGHRLWNVEEAAEKLRRTEKRIRALLTDAEERRYIEDDSVLLWLRELKAVAFDADTLLDCLSTTTALFELDSAEPSRKRKRSCSWLNIQLGPRQRWALDAKIAEINERLHEIAIDRKRYKFQSGDASRRASLRQREWFLEGTASHDGRTQFIISRAKEKEEIVQLLLSDHAKPLPVISIYGAAGIGKTTLARVVYNDAEVRNFFGTMIWVCLSDRCDAKKATKKILEAAFKVKCDPLSLEILQRRLREHLSTRKFLLVIDNLWAEDYQFWELLQCPLLAGEKGSKVLITTRNERVLRRTSTIHCLHLKGLEVEECWLLLRHYAFSQGQYMEKDDLMSIGRRIAESCQGSPSAAKSLGMLLSDSNRNKEEWDYVLSQMQILKDDHSKILPSLKISYHHLPYHLKRLFALCSIFPLGCEFQRDEVVRLWIAEGLIQCNGRRRMEAEAEKFFEELLSRSFFETSSCFPKKKYRVPSLMHDLARLVSEHEFLSIEPANSQDEKNSKLVRYASVLCQKGECPMFDEICCYQNIRLLKLCTEERVPLKHVPSELFLKLCCLRTLDLSHSDVEELPDSVGHLMYLRYLGLCNTLIKRLPESVSGLFNLQTLELTECYRLIKLPEGMSRLVNLRHVCLHLEWDRIIPIPLPRGIDKLTSLQTLSRFTVTADDEGHCNMAELKNLNIRGELCLLNLEAATSENAKESNLSGKQDVENLMLQWSNGTYSYEAVNDSTLVIESLRPHGRLRCLHINNYPGRKLPGWIGDKSFFCLENMRISYCRNSEFLPLLGELPQLKNLRLEGMYKVKSLASLVGFPSLEVLTLWDMPNLQTWCESEEAELPQLQELYICHCPELQSVTNLPGTLAKLEINNCAKLISLPVVQHLNNLVIHRGGDELIGWISRLSSLTSLTLMHFSETKEVRVQQLAALKRLKLGGFEKLSSLAGNCSLETLSSLECLQISSCPELRKFSVEGLQSLKEFRLRHCAALQALPTGLDNLASLRYLEIRDVPNLEISIGKMVLPNNLSTLDLSGCNALESWCKGIGDQRVRAIHVNIGL